MKKITTLFAAAVMAASASAQTVTESKTFDNMYFGINTGVSTAAKVITGSRTSVRTLAYVSAATSLRYSVSLLRATSTSRR